jgi:hypothetical protein
MPFPYLKENASLLGINPPATVPFSMEAMVALANQIFQFLCALAFDLLLDAAGATKIKYGSRACRGIKASMC